MSTTAHGSALVRPLGGIAFELRAAWATGRRVALSLDACDLDRVEGCVDRVAATNATVTVAGRLVPMDRILAVHHPSRLGDSTAGRSWARAAHELRQPGQLEIPALKGHAGL